jgi:hypothetical protein
MILIGYSIMEVVVVVMLVILIGFLVVLAYKKFLIKMEKGKQLKEDFCVLYNLESNPVGGEIEF